VGASNAVPLAFDTSVSVTVAAGRQTLHGLCVANKSDTNTAKVRFRDGTTDTDPVVWVVTLAPGESVRDWFGPQGVRINGGVRLEVVSAPSGVEGSVVVG
jgi:hypothetical protein